MNYHSTVITAIIQHCGCCC